VLEVFFFFASEHCRVFHVCAAESFCSALLTRNPEDRLGHKGWKDIEKHAFFDDFDFNALRNKTMKPPFVPEETLNSVDSNQIGEHNGKGDEWTDSDEAEFKDWDFFNQGRFEKEVVGSLEWAEENGDLRAPAGKSSSCSIL
jgi:hypothetical protein